MEVIICKPNDDNCLKELREYMCYYAATKIQLVWKARSLQIIR